MWYLHLAQDWPASSSNHLPVKPNQLPVSCWKKNIPTAWRLPPPCFTTGIAKNVHLYMWKANRAYSQTSTALFEQNVVLQIGRLKTNTLLLILNWKTFLKKQNRKSNTTWENVQKSKGHEWTNLTLLKIFAVFLYFDWLFISRPSLWKA